MIPLSGRKERKVSSQRIVPDIHIVLAVPFYHEPIVVPLLQLETAVRISGVLTFGLVTRGNVDRKWEINVTVFRDRVSSRMFCEVR